WFLFRRRSTPVFRPARAHGGSRIGNNAVPLAESVLITDSRGVRGEIMFAVVTRLTQDVAQRDAAITIESSPQIVNRLGEIHLGVHHARPIQRVGLRHLELDVLRKIALSFFEITNSV